jgi:hypothetical protein
MLGEQGISAKGFLLLGAGIITAVLLALVESDGMLLAPAAQRACR